jgi:hypothetical protein
MKTIRRLAGRLSEVLFILVSPGTSGLSGVGEVGNLRLCQRDQEAPTISREDLDDLRADFLGLLGVG